eukprot:1157357-Pelagomonas_calceolata.AAC.6
MHPHIHPSVNPGGGHAFIGLHLAQELLKRGHTVTICNDGDNVSPPGRQTSSCTYTPALISA